MASPRTPLAYVFPSPFISSRIRAPSTSRSNVPPAVSTWHPHPSAAVRVHLRCAANGGNKQNSSDDDPASSNWGQFKPWFRRDSDSSNQNPTSASPETASAEGDCDFSAQRSDVRGHDSSEDTTDSPPKSSENDDSESRDPPKETQDGFRWPWQKEESTNSIASTTNDSSENAEETPQVSKKRVKHSDSKPGPAMDMDKAIPDPKEQPSFQQRVKAIVDVIAPNLPFAKGNDDENGSSEKSTKRENSSKSPKTPTKQTSSIFDLYKPPSPKENTDKNAKEKEPWFTPPWSQSRSSKSSEDSSKQEAKQVDKTVDVSLNPSADSPPISDDPENREEKGAPPDRKRRRTWSILPWSNVPEETKTQDDTVETRQDVRVSSAVESDQSKVDPNLRESFETNSSDEEAEGKEIPSGGGGKKPWFSVRFEKKNVRVESYNEGEDREKDYDDSQVTVIVEPSSSESSDEPYMEAKERDLDSNGGKDTDAEQERELVATKEKAISSPSLPSTEKITFPQRDIANIRLIFGSETFFATDAMSAPGGLIFRGNLRGEPKETLVKLEERLRSRFGDKYTLCLAEGDEDRRPIVVVVPSAYYVKSLTPRQKVMAVGVAMMTASTCLSRGLTANLHRQRIISAHGAPPLNNLMDRLFYYPMSSAVTVACAIVVVLMISQLVQRIVASWRGTRIAAPFVLPSYQLGSFGAVVHVSSPAPSRSALFDIAVSGVATMVAISLVCLVIGLRLSTSFSSVFPVPMSMVSGSVIMGFLTKHVPNGQILVDYGQSLIGLHPLAIIGANCLTIAALNLLPIRLLDGGRIIASLYGRKVGLTVSKVAVLFLLFASSKSPYLIMFLIAVSFGPWYVDRPSRNELTEPDGVRTIVGYIFMLIMIGILLPYPKSTFFGTL